jgi:hypothetical protein
MRYELIDAEEPYTPDNGNSFKVTGLFEMQRLFDDRAYRGWEWAGTAPGPGAKAYLVFKHPGG